jgi:hypothetical protein
MFKIRFELHLFGFIAQISMKLTKSHELNIYRVSNVENINVYLDPSFNALISSFVESYFKLFTRIV